MTGQIIFEIAPLVEWVYANAYNLILVLFGLAALMALAQGYGERRGAKRQGYVYVVQSPTGYYKIGRTKNPEDRLKTFSVKLPFEVQYVCVIPARDMVEMERALHRQYRAQRKNGEWFALSERDIEDLRKLAKKG